MLNMVIGYFWKYLVMGLVLNTTWAFGLAIYIGYRCKWDLDLYEECLDIFTQHKGWSKFVRTSAGRKIITKGLPISYLMWPINIATGASRLPEVFEHINESTRKSGA